MSHVMGCVSLRKSYMAQGAYWYVDSYGRIKDAVFLYQKNP